MSEPASPPLHVERVPLRWSDMDSLGHVNNAVYFTYCESARMGLFDRLKLADYAGDLGPVVVTASCTFKQQLTFPATLAIEVRCSKVGRTSFTLTYDLRRLTADGDPEPDPVCTGESVVVWIDFAHGGSVPLPDAMRGLLQD
ncbi:MAG: acyl-CoA thioesterase [Planctomycetes bacterium]|nr:acyl-CoA thioesterase [Planctomycetota bacterium]